MRHPLCVTPALSLVLSMTLRFVPKFRAQIHSVSESQRCVGRDVRNGGVLQRIKNAVTILSIMVTWTLENGTLEDTLAAMGYSTEDVPTSIYIYPKSFEDKDEINAMVEQYNSKHPWFPHSHTGPRKSILICPTSLAIPWSPRSSRS